MIRVEGRSGLNIACVEEAWVSVPLPFGEVEGPLAERVEAALGSLDEVDLARHPEAFEATNRALLAELEQLEGL